MPLPAAELFFDLLACWVAVGVVGVVLLTGWLTRTTAVVGVSILLACQAALVLGLWMAYRLDTSEGQAVEELAVLQLIGGAGVILLVLAVWALVKLLKRDAAMRPAVETPSESPAKYDRDWLLSLLQARAGSAKERVATPPSPLSDRSEDVPAAKNGSR